MNTQRMTLNTIRWVSALTMVGILAYGFLVPISIVQGYIYSPLLIIGLLGLMGFTTDRLENLNRTSNVYQLKHVKKQCCPTLSKAA